LLNRLKFFLCFLIIGFVLLFYFQVLLKSFLLIRRNFVSSFTLKLTSVFGIIAGYFQSFKRNIFSCFIAKEVPPMNVVYITVSIVIFTISGNFFLIDPYIGFQVFMIYIYTRIYN